MRRPLGATVSNCLSAELVPQAPLRRATTMAPTPIKLGVTDPLPAAALAGRLRIQLGVTGIPESGTFPVPSPPSSGERVRVRGLIHARPPHPASPPKTGERGKTGMPVTPK